MSLAERLPLPPPELSEPVPTTIYKDAAKIGGAVIPFKVEVPDELEDPHPLLIAHGYLGKPFAYDDFREALAQRGRAVVDICPPRHQGIASLHPRNLVEAVVDPMKLLSQSIWGVTKKLREDYEELLDPARVDITGHSMGWPIAVRFALEKPGVVRTLINMEGAGNEDHHTTKDFIPRIIEFTEEEAIPFVNGLLTGERELERGVLHAAKSEAHYVFAHPIRTVAEGLHVSNSYVVEDIKQLKRTQGVGVIAILGEDDRLIPAELTMNHSWDVFDEGEVVDCGHLLPMREPDLTAETTIDLMSRVS